MSDIKMGDSVRVVAGTRYAGAVGKVTSITDDTYPFDVTFNDGGYWVFDRAELELVESANWLPAPQQPMTANEYQVLAIATAMYPGADTFWGLQYAVLGLANEAGELAGVVKKMQRDIRIIPETEITEVDEDVRHRVESELGDCVWYAAAVAEELGTTLEDVMRANIEKLRGRQERGTLGGSGEDR